MYCPGLPFRPLPRRPKILIWPVSGKTFEVSRDRLHLRRTTEQHVPEVEVQVKRRRTASLSNQECQLYPRRSQQQQIPVVDFQAELRQAFLAETPRGG
ncbi:SNRPN upstream reading frame protein isoform X1 [Manis pentadactyla]|uniref:SNRPN upstream reading frame protein isoform X1 n=1 Tax=Manis pentadactyla TaxID=143292 RepID=UPI00255C6250|nr:SNRPN upstream reading frame protein isoform X1 [Manis pentadactyla]